MTNPLTLGLDLGTNSIGWGIINETSKEIIASGARIFPEGVENLGQGQRELSKNASRTGNRSIRRQYFRRRIRKNLLMKILRQNNMAPADQEAMLAWFKLPPYKLRKKALSGNATIEELGRIFYHLSQRRGFQSNSRSATANEDGAIYKTKEGKIGIPDTQKLIENSNSKTLGGALHDLEKEHGTDDQRLRSRYTTRQMYVDEFEKIWDEQSKYHPALTLELKTAIGGRKRDGYKNDGVLFFQRPLRSQKQKIGKCSFEKNKPKCPISHPLFETFRAWQFANSIKCNGNELHLQEKKKVVDYLLKYDKKKFLDIRKWIKKADTHYTFNYQDEDKIVGSETISKLSNKKIFGDVWFNFSEKEQDDIWHIFYHFDDKEKFIEYANNKWGFDKIKAEGASKFYPKQGYASLSKKAIRNILPFLKMGYRYDIAVAFGGVKNAFGNLWNEVSEEDMQLLKDNLPSILESGKEEGYIGDLKAMLKDYFNMNENQFKKLYHHSADIHASKKVAALPIGLEADKEIMKLRNPIVTQAIFELRKLVNSLLKRFGEFDGIKVELARDLKIPKMVRQKIRWDNQQREKNHDRIKAILKETGKRITHENILKYKLWEECQKTCPFTGDPISIEQLFEGDVEIEHIFPYSRSGDDSYLNKTLCFSSENKRKGNRTPYEYYFKEFGQAKWEDVKSKVLRLFYDTKEFPNRYKKFERFASEKFNDDFISRQLNDTRYISKEAKNYLRKICDNINVYPGQMTAKLRHHWGLNSIIGNLDDEENIEKDRTDHRHHAIDALVVACCNVSQLQQLSKRNRYRKEEFPKSDLEEPLPNFRNQVIQSLKNILISHKKNNKILTTRNYKIKKDGVVYENKGVAARGELHKETVYGKRQAPNQKSEGFHVRKSLVQIENKKHIDKIVDPKIRQLILDHLIKEGVDISIKNFKVPPGAFFEKPEGSVQSLPKVFLPNKNGKPVPITKVRIREEIGRAVQLKDNINQFVNPRNNHHVLIYRDANGNLKEYVATLWEAVERKRMKLSAVQLPPDGVEIITTLQINDMFLIGLKEEEINFENPKIEFLSDYLFRVQKLSSMYFTFRHHLASTVYFSNQERRIVSFKKWVELNPIKVHISPDGKIKFI